MQLSMFAAKTETARAPSSTSSARTDTAQVLTMFYIDQNREAQNYARHIYRTMRPGQATAHLMSKVNDAFRLGRKERQAGLLAVIFARSNNTGSSDPAMADLPF